MFVIAKQFHERARLRRLVIWSVSTWNHSTRSNAFMSFETDEKIRINRPAPLGFHWLTYRVVVHGREPSSLCSSRSNDWWEDPNDNGVLLNLLLPLLSHRRTRRPYLHPTEVLCFHLPAYRRSRGDRRYSYCGEARSVYWQPAVMHSDIQSSVAMVELADFWLVESVFDDEFSIHRKIWMSLIWK